MNKRKVRVWCKEPIFKLNKCEKHYQEYIERLKMFSGITKEELISGKIFYLKYNLSTKIKYKNNQIYKLQGNRWLKYNILPDHNLFVKQNSKNKDGQTNNNTGIST